MAMNRAQRVRETRGLRARAPLAAQFEDCVQALVQLSDAIKANQPDSTNLWGLAEHCRSRLRAWGIDSGASSRALDHGVKSSPGLAQLSNRLLNDLHAALDQAITGIRPQAVEENENAPQADKEEASKPKTNPEESAADDADVEVDPEMCLEEALDILGSLSRLLPVLQDPVDDIQDYSPSTASDGYSIDLFRDLAKQLFPAISVSLADRLAESNIQRRQNLHYLRQRLKGATDPHSAGQATGQAVGLQSMRVQRKSSTVQQSTGADSDAGTSTVRSHVETVLSRRTYQDQDSTTSVTDSHQPNLVSRIIPRLVPPEQPGTTEPAENTNTTVKQCDCLYCHFELPLTVTAKPMTNEEWLGHVYLDLKPYICTFGHCNRTNSPFRSKDEWFKHEMNFHRSPFVWLCGMCSSPHESEDDFRRHLQLDHPDITHESVSAIVENCMRYSTQSLPPQDCLLCGHLFTDMDELKSHVGAHLETFALAATLDMDPQDEVVPESEGLLREYLEDMEQRARNTSNGDGPSSVNEAKTIIAQPITITQTMLEEPQEIEGNRADETSEMSNLDVYDAGARAQKDNLWNEKVQGFLAKQSSQEYIPTEKRCNVPNPNEHFVGRFESISSIHEALSLPGQVCTISGRGGIGKTALATQYVHACEHEYSYFFWVEAATAEASAEKYARIATVLDTGGKPLADENARIYFVKECLAKTEKRWLLVFDNVTKWSDIARFIPRNFPRSKGSVLITTREGPLLASPSRQREKPLELEGLSVDHACEFLLKSLQPRLKAEDVPDHEDYKLAEEIVDKVGRLPLAISMIVGYIKVSRCPLEDFNEMWDVKESRRKLRVQKDTAEDETVDAIIDTLWEIGISEVQMNCRRLLDVFSFLDPQCIQKSLLVGDHKEDYLEFLNESEAISYRRMINQLSGRRLIDVRQREQGEPYYVIHRLLQQKMRGEMDDYGFADALRKVFRLIRKRYPKADPQQVPDPRSWDVCRQYMPHVFTFHRVFEDFKDKINITQLVEPKAIEVAELFYDAGFHVWARGTTGYDGLPFLKSADGILDSLRGGEANDRLRANIHSVTGCLLLGMGSVAHVEGGRRLLRAQELRKRIWLKNPSFDDDVMYRNSATDYSLFLLNDHQFVEAGQLMRECFERYHVWGPEEENPFEYSKYYGNYSVVLIWEGRAQEAVQSLEKCIQLTLKFSGRGPQYYRRQFLLGNWLLQAGDVQGALDKQLEVLTGRLEVLGKYHDVTISSMYAVGAMYHHIGDPNTAIEYLKQTLECARNSRCPKDALGRAQFHLASLYEELGTELEQAKALKEEARLVLAERMQYVTECVRSTGDEMMIFDDLQSTFSGRYTGVNLLKCLQDWHQKLLAGQES